MFQHVTILVSFIFAIALTHVFSSASTLILERDRVRFSWLLDRVDVERRAKPRWPQWVGVAGMLAQNVWYSVFYTLNP